MNQTQPNSPLSVKFPEALTQREYEQIDALQALCCAHGDGHFKLELDYKLSLAQAEGGGKGAVNDFLYYDADKLIAYLGMCAFGGDAELNGMTHPDYRARGVFGRLFALAVGECKRRGMNSVLLLCDRSSEEGLRFIRKTGATLHHSELEMVLKPDTAAGERDFGVTLRRAQALDAREVARQDAIFGDEAEPDDSFEPPALDADGSETYLALAQGQTVGKVRLELLNGCGGIYGLGVLPEYRGLGYGKGVLLRGVEKLREKGAENIRLQVFESNGPARHIYEKAGFEPVYVMDYFQLKI